MTTITRDEWLKELERVVASSTDQHGLTFEELRDVVGRAGCSEDRLRKMVRSAVAAGTVVVERGVRTNVVGVHVSVPVYRMRHESA